MNTGARRKYFTRNVTHPVAAVSHVPARLAAPSLFGHFVLILMTTTHSLPSFSPSLPQPGMLCALLVIFMIAGVVLMFLPKVSL